MRATWVLGLAWLAGVGAILTGLTDYKDTRTDSAERDVAGLHGLINFVGNPRLRLSVFQRLAEATTRRSGCCWWPTW